MTSSRSWTPKTKPRPPSPDPLNAHTKGPMRKRKLTISVRDEHDRLVGETTVETDYAALTILPGDPNPSTALAVIPLLVEETH